MRLASTYRFTSIRFTSIVYALALLTSACSGDGAGGKGDSTGADGGADGGSGGDGDGSGGDRCKEDSDCSDRVFCNGRERCEPGAAGADESGCLPAEPECGERECDEDARRCACDEPDRDGDGRDDIACGGEDCDDNDARRFGGNVEVCDDNGHDEDCDLTTLGGPGDMDVDSDGFVSIACCNAQLDGSVSCGNDCDDSREGIHPEATEACNGIDDNCDGILDGIDEPGDLRLRWYVDRDGDGHGRAGDFIETCGDPSGFGANYANKAGDCNDSPEQDTDTVHAAAVNPATPERCNVAGVDDDCDGTVDEGCECFSGETKPCGPFDGNGEPILDAGGNPLVEGQCAAGHIACADGRWVDDTCIGSVGPVPEVCDQLDNDCDGTIDEPDSANAQLWYPDLDGDGFGFASGALRRCFSPGQGWLLNGGDCLDDPNDPVAGAIAQDIHVGATETCDGAIDHNCNGLVDENCPCTDGDFRTCGPFIEGTTTPVYDANGAPETRGRCQPGSQACLGGIWTASCEGNVDQAPTEICDADEQDDQYVDDDCDGLSDEADAIGASYWYVDRDSDNYGDPATEERACHQPDDTADGYTFIENVGGDCNDGNGNVRPGAFETCDGVIDHNCNGNDDLADGCVCINGDLEACGPFAADGTDLAGLGTGECNPGQRACLSGQWASCSGAVGPVPEACDFRDNDCDGRTDEAGAVGERAFYADTDGDGFGDAAGQPVMACNPPAGYVLDNTDCNDGDGLISPAAYEFCDGVINHDCDAIVADSGESHCNCIDGQSRGCGPFDNAGNDLGGLSTGDCMPGTQLCASGQWGSCVGAIGPSPETCDFRDNDCDGSTDEPGAVGEQPFYLDSDNDNFGDANVSAFMSCNRPAGYVQDRTDCDDGDNSISPASYEVCDGAINHDCDALVDDIDEAHCACINGDSESCGPYDSGGNDLAGLATGECQPGNRLCVTGQWGSCVGDVGPVPESCDFRDNDCDGGTDEPGAIGEQPFYVDADADGYGNQNAPAVNACRQPAGHVANNGDCNDANAQISPSAYEICDGAINHDCDGVVADINEAHCDCINGTEQGCGPFDSGGNDLGGLTTGQCNPGTQRCVSGQWGSCAGDVGPVTETCDFLDNDCDGSTDEPGAVGQSAWYPDVDGDGFGSSAASATLACNQPANFVRSNDDCDDADRYISPVAYEVCDGSVNHDCDAIVADINEAHCNCINGTQQNCGPLDASGNPILNGMGNPLTTGACYQGTQGCVAGTWETCSQYQGPTAQEICNNGIADDNCDGLIDELDPTATGLSSWYLDADGDQLGDAAERVAACVEPPDAGQGPYVSNGADCYDGDGSVLSINSCAQVAAAGTEYTCQLSSVSGHDDCVVTGCPSGLGDCNDDHLDHCETDTDTSLRYCGGCDRLLADSCQLVCGEIGGMTECDEIAQMSAGGAFTCATRDSGKGACWGSNSTGALGTGVLGISDIPIQLDSLSSMSVVSSGGSHACAINAGSVYCWGANAYYQLGVGDTVEASSPRPLGGALNPAIDVSAGGSHSCGIATGGAAYCWGRNNYGQAGNDVAANATVGTPGTVKGPAATTLSNATRIEAGSSHTCALRADKTVVCWGLDFYGQLGNGAGALAECGGACSGTFVSTGLANVNAISAGGFHSCALVSGGDVRCWGDIDGPSYGGFATVTSPTSVAALSGASAIASGDFHVCGVIAGGNVRCLGSNLQLQLGSSNTAATDVTLGVSGVASITAGGGHTCAIWADGTARCWGGNSSGQLGVGDTTSRAVPTDVAALSP